MKGKKKNKKKVGKILLLGMSFLLTIVLTFTITLAWFYDSDWASNSVTMAGTVGIEVRKQGATSATSGSGALHFVISTDKAYPGQAIDVSASAYNNGGASKMVNDKEGSPWYLRASFAVYTNIGLDDESTTDIDEAAEEAEMNSRSLYDFLLELISTQNGNASDYQWIYYSNAAAGNGQLLSPSGTDANNVQYYYEGTAYASQDDVTTAIGENTRGYFYLCYKPTSTAVINKKDHTTAVPSTTTPAAEGKTGILMPVAVGSEAVFLWNSTFIIPWTLTNYSADKDIFVVVEFQAIQTFIPEIESTGVINNAANNQLSAEKCYYYSKSVQTVFNSSGFEAPDLTITTKDGRYIDFGTNTDYQQISMPKADAQGSHPTATK